jgi:hypothetical protein
MIMKWPKHIGQIGLSVLLLVVGGVVTYYIAIYQNRTQYLDFSFHKSESLLGKANDVGDSISFTVNGKPVRDISELDIEIFNNTNRDYQDLPIVIEFDQDYTFETISTNFLDQNKSKELIDQLGFRGTSKHVRFGHTIKLLSRRDEPVFYMKFLFKNSSIPKFKIYANQAVLAPYCLHRILCQNV